MSGTNADPNLIYHLPWTYSVDANGNATATFDGEIIVQSVSESAGGNNGITQADADLRYLQLAGGADLTATIAKLEKRLAHAESELKTLIAEHRERHDPPRKRT